MQIISFCRVFLLSFKVFVFHQPAKAFCVLLKISSQCWVPTSFINQLMQTEQLQFRQSAALKEKNRIDRLFD